MTDAPQSAVPQSAPVILPALVPGLRASVDARGLPEGIDAASLARGVLEPIAPELRAPLLGAVASLGAPAGELVCSPISARVAGWGVSEGLAFVHHELRCAPPLHPDLRPEVEMGPSEPAEAVWRDGMLVVPKYFSAFLDAPLPVFDPNLRVKWRTHEILHRLVRFFWRPDMSRFEAYLGARLSELLPVAHWYGFDEMGRSRCPRHEGKVPLRELCRDCESMAGPYWEALKSADPVAVEARSQAALAHLAEELEACRMERESGRTVAIVRPGLDASSDAVGYLRGHWNRITGWSFGAWIERFGIAGRDYFETTLELQEHVVAVFRRLVGEEVRVEENEGGRRRERHRASETAYRALMFIELADDDQVEETVMPAIDALAETVRAGEPTALALDALEERLDRAVGAEDASAVFAGGYTWVRPIPSASARQVAIGLRSGLPRSLAETSDATLAEWADTLCRDRAFAGSSSLASRFARFAAAVPDFDPEVRKRVVFESWLLSSPRYDEEAERFAVLPEGFEASPTAGRLRLNTTHREGRFELTTVAEILDGFEGSGLVPLLGVHYGGEPRVIQIDDDVRAVVDAAAEGRWGGAAEDRRSLLESGILVYLPTAR